MDALARAAHRALACQMQIATDVMSTVGSPSLSDLHVAPERHGWDSVLQHVLVLCGVLSSLVYLAANVAAGVSWSGYSFADQTISELSAIGAPSRPIWLAFAVPYGVLSIGFAIGVWRSAHGKRGLRIAAGLMLAMCVLGPFWPPMHLRGVPVTATDIVHVVFACVFSVLYLLAIGFAASSFGTRFRLYSIATIAVSVLFGFATFWLSPGVARNEATPWIGVYERLDFGAYLVWLAVLAIVLLRGTRRSRRRLLATPGEGARA